MFQTRRFRSTWYPVVNLQHKILYSVLQYARQLCPSPSYIYRKSVIFIYFIFILTCCSPLTRKLCPSLSYIYRKSVIFIYFIFILTCCSPLARKLCPSPSYIYRNQLFLSVLFLFWLVVLHWLENFAPPLLYIPEISYFYLFYFYFDLLFSIGNTLLFFWNSLLFSVIPLFNLSWWRFFQKPVAGLNLLVTGSSHTIITCQDKTSLNWQKPFDDQYYYLFFLFIISLWNTNVDIQCRVHHACLE